MKSSLRILMVAVLATPLVVTAAPQQETEGAGPLPWAYAGDAPKATPPNPAAKPDTSPKQVPGSDLSFTLAEIRNGSGPADWHPGDHGAMPDIVAHGKRPD